MSRFNKETTKKLIEMYLDNDFSFVDIKLEDAVLTANKYNKLTFLKHKLVIIHTGYQIHIPYENIIDMEV